MSHYYIDATIAVSCYTTDVDGNLQNADSAPVLTVVGPSGTSTPTLANPSTGEYTTTFTPDAAGRWVGTFAATVDGIDYVDQTVWLVEDEAGPLVDLYGVKDHLNISQDTTTYDDELALFIDRATDLLEAYTGRALVRRTYTSETYSGEGSSMLLLRHAPVISVSSVTESGSSVSASGYSLDGDAGVLWRLGGTYYPGYWSEGIRNIAVTYVAGYANPPGRAVQACLELVRHLWETQRGTFAPARAGASTDDYVPGLSFSMPRRVAELVDDLRVPGVA